MRALAEGRADEAGAIGDYARQAADQLAEFAGRLEEGGIGSLLSDLGTFARRRPGLFLLSAAGTGFFVGRFLRNQNGSGQTAPAPDPAPGGQMPTAKPQPLGRPIGLGPTPGIPATPAPVTSSMTTGPAGTRSDREAGL